MTFAIGRTALATDAATVFDGGSCRDLKNKLHVTVTAVAASTGAALHALRVEFENRD